ncbi:MAG: methionyl-tRNA formyltransferase [bacterium]|nr:methionyl-tRNA formyltransferase [bacterium]
MNTVRTIFFGSTSDSLLVLDALSASRFPLHALHVVGIVTQPARPLGRNQVLAPTPVEVYGRDHGLTVLSFPTQKEKPYLYADESVVADTLAPLRADLLISASYGQRIPAHVIRSTRFGGLNIHPSLLPRWRGADPTPWSILCDDQTGVTIVTLSERFDEGRIIAQKKRSIDRADTRELLRKKLFDLGAELLVDSLPDYLSGAIEGISQKNELATYARRLTRPDGFIPWELLTLAREGTLLSPETIQEYNNVTIVKEGGTIQNLRDSSVAGLVERAIRAFSPWPGVWTLVKVERGKGEGESEKKRVKILEGRLEGEKLVIHTVQVEGKKPISFAQFSENHLTPVIPK